MAINKTLKFSWGHIIAFIALIFVSYITFMGITYLTEGNFWYAGAGVVVVDLILTIFFIIPQMLKGADEKFSKKIVFERILFFATPFFFIAVMIPFAHFWTVFGNRAEVETSFAESIVGVKGMFTSYENYADNRINAFEKRLADSVVSAKAPTKDKKSKGKKSKTTTPKKANTNTRGGRGSGSGGGSGSGSSIDQNPLAANTRGSGNINPKPIAKNSLSAATPQAAKKPSSKTSKGQKPAFSKVRQKNAVEALKLQLFDQNYHNLKNSAETWIDNATKATVWNVFMIGNIDKIEEAMDNWNLALNSFSSKIMKDEDKSTVAFSDNDESVIATKESLRALRAGYTEMGMPTPLAIGTALLLYFMLLFPYLIQNRNTKNLYRLIGSEGSGKKSKREKSRKNKHHETEPQDELDAFVVEESSSIGDGDYDSFSM